jgi:maltose O-acetyltransferase
MAIMTEREKCLAGLPYDTRDPELLAMYHAGKACIAELERLPTTDIVGRAAILKKLFGSVGDGVWVERNFNCDYGKNISIGANTYINYSCTFLDGNRIAIGENCLIAPGVQLTTALHPTNPAERFIPDESGNMYYNTMTKPVTIGSNVWLGGGVIVLPGVTIGDGSVIGAGSVVTKDIPANVLAFGTPCHVIRSVSA